MPIKLKPLVPEYDIFVVPIVMESAPTARLLRANTYQLAFFPNAVGDSVVAGTSLHPLPYGALVHPAMYDPLASAVQVTAQAP